MMKTAIVIATYRRPVMIERLLTNLGECILPPAVEIFVVENGPQSGVESACIRHTVGNRVRYLHSPIAGKTHALNQAIRFSDADFFIFFDDDIIVPPTIVETYAEAAQRYGLGHFFGGPLIADAELPCPPHLLPHLPSSAIGRSFADQETELEVSQFLFFFGANWAVFRADLIRTGFYNEDLEAGPTKYSPADEETELQQRLVTANVRPIYLPNAAIHHFVRKECYTLEWVCDRHFRRGISDWIKAENHQRGYEVLGISFQGIRESVKQKTKLRIARLLNFPLERQTSIEVRGAYWRGWVYGAWTRVKK
jgi:GT2 family glycosyltransferase